MDTSLARVTDEWRDVYLTLSQRQKADELVEPDAKRVPADIERLPELAALRANDAAALHGPFERAAKLIRPQVLHRASDVPAPAGPGGGKAQGVT